MQQISSLVVSIAILIMIGSFLLGLVFWLVAPFLKKRIDPEKKALRDFKGFSDNLFPDDVSFISQNLLLSTAEQKFYHELKEAIGNEFGIAIKVRVADILKPVSKNRSNWQTAFNKTCKKHVDFVLFNPNTSEIKTAIELDDSSHQRTDRKTRDESVSEMFKSAGIPLLHYPVRATYPSSIFDDIKQ